MIPWESSLLVLGTVGAVLVVALWVADRRRYAFVICIDHGVPKLRRGNATGAFLDNVAQVCRENGIERGWVGGIRQRLRIRLVFSRSMPAACQQQLRNIWQVIGWGNRRQGAANPRR